MESKNKVFVAVGDEAIHGKLVLKHARSGYFAGCAGIPYDAAAMFESREDAKRALQQVGEDSYDAAAMFESREDAKRALQQVGEDSVIFTAVPRMKLYILDNGNTGYSEDGIPSALPKHHRALSPEEIANERKFAGKISRPVDFKAQEEEHAAAKLPEMERSLIAEFAERCKMGFAEYGPVFLGKRNWGKELKEEALDGLFYALMAAKTMEKYGGLIKALEEASDDELSMDACSPDPLKQAAYLVKQLSSELTKAGEFLASEKRISANLAETVRDLRGYDLAYLKKALEDEREAKRIAEESSQRAVSELMRQRNEAVDRHCEEMNRAKHLANELDRRLQERDNYRESCEKLRKENLDMRALMESALSLGGPRG